MKNAKYIFLTLLAALLTACTSSSPKTEEQDPELIQFEQERMLKNEIARLGDYTMTDSVSGGGHRYQYTITRTALDSVGVVTDEDGYRAYDNTISLSILRDGALFYHSTLTRSLFRPYLSADDYNQFILMNAVFEHVLGDGLRFIVSLGDGAANGDVFVQYALDLHGDGTTTISTHEMFEENEINRFEEEKKQ